eukprot:scaffold261309_cov23-Tisochrysis_lutea.AAC.1
MEQHLSSSQKAVTLEAENQTLKAAKQALEVELEALRKPTFELNSGEELEVRICRAGAVMPVWLQHGVYVVAGAGAGAAQFDGGWQDIEGGDESNGSLFRGLVEVLIMQLDPSGMLGLGPAWQM